MARPAASRVAAFALMAVVVVAQLRNPDRGLFTQTLRHFDVDDEILDITDGHLKFLRMRGKTLTARQYFFGGWQLKHELPSTFVAEFRSDLALIRKHGLRVILRFAYTEETNSTLIDAPLEVVASHLNVIRPLLAEFEPVISVFQAGFIGSWGEMYSTTHYEDDASKQAVLRLILGAVPPSIPVAVRATFYYDLIEDDMPMETTRLALFDDCVLADPTDVGTFDLWEPSRKDLLLIREEMKRFTNIGTTGETCNAGPLRHDLANCNYALRHFAAIKMLALNDRWETPILQFWKSSGCWQNITDKLGYVPTLESATHEKVVIFNAGWSKPPRKSDAYAYLVSQSLASSSSASVSVVAIRIALESWDFRNLPPNSDTTFHMSLTPTDDEADDPRLIRLGEVHEVFIAIETAGPGYSPEYRIVFTKKQWGPRFNRIGVRLAKGTPLSKGAQEGSLNKKTGAFIPFLSSSATGYQTNCRLTLSVLLLIVTAIV